MKYSWKDKIRNYGLLQRAIAFSITLIIILVFIPKERLFKYEYQQNQPWKHEKLYAPFEFGVRKSKQEIIKEKEEVFAKQPLIFEYKNEINHAVFEQIEFELGDYFHSDSLCKKEFIEFEESFYRILSTALIDRSSIPKGFENKTTIGVRYNAEIKLVAMSQTLTIQKVIDSLLSNLSEESQCKKLILNAFIDHIKPNATYDDSTTQKLAAAAFLDILMIQGKVEKGEAIIDKGDIVTEEKFKILESLKAEYREKTAVSNNFNYGKIAEFSIIIILLGLLMLFVYLNQNHLFNDPRPITLALALLSILYILSSAAITSKYISVYAIPIGIAPLLMRMFFDFRLSLFNFIVTVLIIALFVANPLEYIIIQLSAISFATLFQAANNKRSRSIATASIVFLGYSVIYTLVSIAQNSNIHGIETSNYGWFAINAVMTMVIPPMVFIVEKVFGYVSDTTLLELGESNQPLLKELATKAPGTFQHSLQVANLAEKIANRIGGDAILLRTAALYHDIGKMNEPQYFIENQFPDNNPHDDLDPEESAQIILNHVSKGIELARQANLPFDLVQFIRTHHGTSKIRFFLKKAIEKYGQDAVDIRNYAYPGPKPKTKEQAILMIADSVEAASRSLKSHDYETLDTLVENIVNSQLNDGQFEEASITFKDINAAKDVLKTMLKGIYHQRISY